MTPSLQTKFHEETITYDGTQLSPHWIYKNFDIMGDSVVAFIGEANVALSEMVDLEDVKKKAPIYSPRMLHFVGECFVDRLEEGVLLQHLFAQTLYSRLWELGGRELSRRGNDLFFKHRKLSVSIATKSPVSVLMHWGVNIRTEGTPIPTGGLDEMGIDPKVFAIGLLETLSSDWSTWWRARVKVIPR